MSNQPQIIRKISGKTLTKDVKKAPCGELYKVVGVAQGIKAGESNYGGWECLTGRFRAIVAGSGEVFEAPRCFLPDVAHNMVADQLKLGADSVEFGFSVQKVESSTSSCGYEYSVVPLIAPSKESDPLERLFASAGITPQIEAPKESEKKK